METKKFCVLGNAMNASQMNLGEDISSIQTAISIVLLALLIPFYLF